MNPEWLKTGSFRTACMLALAVLLGACGTGHERLARPDALAKIKPTSSPVTYARLGAGDAAALKRQSRRPRASLPKPLEAEIVVPKKPLQCVPYARDLSNIQIRGDAWTWWDQAKGRYPRSGEPRPGSVMVLKRKNASNFGHVAHVDEIVDDRTVIVSHANWLNKGRLHNKMPVIDVSKNNDWSAVRFWNAEGGHFGGNTYHPYGFIHQEGEPLVAGLSQSRR